MVGRTHSHRPTNASFEAVNSRVGSLEGQLAVVNRNMMMMMKGTGMVDKPMPSIPFKIAERADGEGVFVTVSIQIPKNLGLVRVQLIRKFDNAVQSGETTAAALIRARAEVKTFPIEVTDEERMAGLVIRSIGPLRPRDDAEKNKYQLTRLIGKDVLETLVVQNPDESPYDQIPFDVFVVRSGGTSEENRFFTIGTSGVSAGPSLPSDALIISNAVDLETQASDATVRFKVFASTNMTTTFADLDINECEVILRPFADANDATGATDEPMHFGGVVTDRAKPFILIDAPGLPLGKRYKWVRNVTRNGSGAPQRGNAASTISFYAGGDPPTAGIPEIEAFTISVVQRDNNHSIITATITQPVNSSTRPRAALLKRLTISMQEPGQAVEIIEKIALLDQEDVFVQGATTSFKRKVKHRANQAMIRYNATIFGITYRASDPTLALIKRDATEATGNSNFADAPSAPSANLLSTLPDDDTESGSDALADFTVFARADQTQTFRQTGCDNVAILLQKKSALPNDDPDPDGGTLIRLPKFVFPVEDLDLDRLSATFRVRGLKLGRNYIWRRNIAIRSGINVKSAPGTVQFRAGTMILDPAGIAITGTATKIKKRRAEITITITQTTPPVLLKNVEIHQDLQDGSGFIEIRQIRLKDRNEFQIAGATATVRRRVHIDPGVSGIAYFLRLRAVGGGTKDFPAPDINGQHIIAGSFFTQATAGASEAPSELPAVPSLADIRENDINLDRSMGAAKVGIDVYADWTKTKTFAQVNADGAKIVLADPGDAAARERYTFPATLPDPVLTFVTVEVPSLVAGKPYLIRRAITTRNGVPAKSAVSDVAFVAGGPKGTVGTFGLPELSDVSVTLAQIMDDANKADSRSAQYTLNFTQAKTQTGTGTASSTSGSQNVVGVGTDFANQLRTGYNIQIGSLTRRILAIQSATALMVETPFTATTGLLSYTFTPPVILIKRIEKFIVRNNNPSSPKARGADRILDKPVDDNNQPIFTAGVKSLTDDINVPKKSGFKVRLRIIAVGDNSREIDSGSMTSAADPSFMDDGAPSGMSQIPRMRWTNRHLRVNFTSSFIAPGGAMGANNNLNTQVTNKLIFFFTSGGNVYLWHPVSRQTLLSAFPIDPLTNTAQAAFFIDIGKQSVVSFPNGIPKNMADGFNEIDVDDSVVYNQIQANGGFLFSNLYVFNQFNEVLTGALVGQAVAVFIGVGWQVNEFGF